MPAYSESDPSAPASGSALVILVMARLVVVAPVVVAKRAVKSWKVEEPETERLVALVSPVFDMEKRVEVEKVLVELATRKSVVGVTFTLELAAKIERVAYGELVPIPRKPLAVRVVVLVCPAEKVLARAVLANNVVEVELVVVELRPVKFCKVVEAKVMSPPQNCDAVVDVATR